MKVKKLQHTEENTEYMNGAWIYHYLSTIKKKPGALAGSLALKQAHQKLHQIHNRYYIKKEKEFIELLELIGEKGLGEIEKVIEKLKKINPMDITTEKIKLLCSRKEEEIGYVYKDNSIVEKANEILQAYGNLLQEKNTDFDEGIPIL